MSEKQQLIIDQPQAADLSHTSIDGQNVVPITTTVLPRVDAYPLIERAVEKALDPSQIKALVDLHEQMRRARAEEEFAAAMNACQAEMPLIVKDAKNTQTSSLYARMETIQHMAKPLLTRHGFALSFAEADSPDAKYKRTICDVRHRAGHCVRYHLDLPPDGIGPKGNPIGGMNSVQGAISTGTYAQRILTCRIFNITVADTDLDGRPASVPNQEQRADAPKSQPRGQRQQRPQTVTAEQITFLLNAWKDTAKEPTPEAWADFVTVVCGRMFDVKKSINWTAGDCDKIRERLGIPSTEQLDAHA